jgi:hypothetical protein
MRSTLVLLAAAILGGCSPGGGPLAAAVGSEVTATLRSDIQGYSTILPANGSREAGHVVRQVSGKLLRAENEWLVIEVTKGSGHLPRTVYVRQDAVITLDQER